MNTMAPIGILIIWASTMALFVGWAIWQIWGWGWPTLLRKLCFAPKSMLLWIRAGLFNYSVLFYGLSVWFALCGLAYHLSSPNDGTEPLAFYDFVLESWWHTSLIVPLFIIPYLLLSRLALQLEAPEAFAQRTVRSHRPADAIILTCHLVLDLLCAFRERNPNLRSFYTESEFQSIAMVAFAQLLDKREVDEGFYESVRNDLYSRADGIAPKRELGRSVNRFVHKHRKQFRRIEALKNEISVHMDIPARRFCDRFIGFSPSLVEARIAKLDPNSRLIATLEEPSGIPRIVELAAQNKYILEWVELLYEDQKALLASKPVITQLCDLVADKSASSALHTYASMIQSVADDSRLSKTHKAAMLRFIFKRQFAYAYFSPHYLLMSALQDNQDVFVQLKLMGWTPPAETSASDPRTGPDDKAERETEANDPVNLNQFRDLFAKTNKAVFTQRKQVVDSFMEILASLLADTSNGTRFFVVTSGYGRIVRTVLKEIARSAPTYPELQFIHFGHVSSIDKDALGSRLLRHELIHEVQSDLNTPGIATELGNASTLFESIRPEDVVLCVFGVEVFERIDNAERMDGENPRPGQTESARVHSPRARELLQHLTTLQARQVHAYALAEPYKDLASICRALPERQQPWLDPWGVSFGALASDSLHTDGRRLVRPNDALDASARSDSAERSGRDERSAFYAGKFTLVSS